ncbi:MAG: hypothetical protein K0R54_5038 [Clostridiaceae bacterium]|jgi:hypothetical protein|nr:hypothetical protein [Clostridiaceae bacterium]
MFNIIINLLIILVGVTFIFLGIYGSHKKVMKLHIKDKGILEKYLKSQRLLDLITGFCYVILGIFSALNLLTGEHVGLLSSIILVLNTIIDFGINKKYEVIN